MAVSQGPAPGAAGLHLVDGLSLLRPEEQVRCPEASGQSIH